MASENDSVHSDDTNEGDFDAGTYEATQGGSDANINPVLVQENYVILRKVIGEGDEPFEFKLLFRPGEAGTAQTIGRGPKCTFPLPKDPKMLVSGLHCVFLSLARGINVVDLSRNGTFVISGKSGERRQLQKFEAPFPFPATQTPSGKFMAQLHVGDILQFGSETTQGQEGVRTQVEYKGAEYLVVEGAGCCGLGSRGPLSKKRERANRAPDTATNGNIEQNILKRAKIDGSGNGDNGKGGKGKGKGKGKSWGKGKRNTEREATRGIQSASTAQWSNSASERRADARGHGLAKRYATVNRKICNRSENQKAQTHAKRKLAKILKLAGSGDETFTITLNGKNSGVKKKKTKKKMQNQRHF